MMDPYPHTVEDEDLDRRLFVGSVFKAMRVMEVFDRQHRALSIAEIAENTGLGRSAAQRFVYTLEKIGYIRRDGTTKRYMLSNRSFRFVQSLLSANTALEGNFHLLSRLTEQTGETVSWVERDGDEIVVVSSVPSPHRTAIVLPIGSRFPILTASSGQLFLADEPRDVIQSIYRRADPDHLKRLSNRDPDSYIEMIQQHPARGYAMTEKDVDVSSLSVSAPIRDLRGRMIAAINVSILRERLQPQEVRDRIVPLLVETANEAVA